MGSGQSLGCKIIDSGRKPDKNSPFTRNTNMIDTLIDNKCTDYDRSLETNQIVNWQSPKCLKDGVLIDCSSGDTSSTGNLVPPNICFQNAAFLGINSNAGFQKSFTTDYCQNISNADNIDFFNLPQDSPALRAIRIGPPRPEWDLPSNAYINIKETFFNQQNFKKSLENEAQAGFAYGTLRGLRELKNSNRGISRFSQALKRARKANQKPDENGDETNDGTEAAEEATEEAAEEATEEAAEEGAIVAAETTTEATIASTTPSLLASLGAAAEAVPFVGIATFIAAGFAQDLAQSNCSFDSMNPPTLVQNNKTGTQLAACCRNSCAISGIKTMCTRNGGFGYNASLFYCCMQDYDCYKNKKITLQTSSSSTSTSDNNVNNRCFNTYTDKVSGYPKIATCHPDFRNLGSNSCSDAVISYCMGETPFGLNQSSLLDAWSENSSITFGNDNYQFSVKSPCLNFIARQLVNGIADLEDNVCSWQDFLDANLDLAPENLNPVGLISVQETINALLDRYLKVSGSPVGKINADGYLQSSDFLSWFFGFCKKYPFLCQNSLSKFCYNLTAAELMEKKETINACGCYMQDSQYEKYTKYGIDRQCSPLCNLPDNIPLVGDDGIKIPCTDSVCMIDDVSITLANTFTEGPINFNQTCGSCGGSKILKEFNSEYQYLDNNNLSKFFVLAPLTKDDYNDLSINDSFFNNQSTNSFYDQNYRNTNLVAFDIIDTTTDVTYPISEDNTYNLIMESNGKVFNNVKFNLGIPIVVTGTTDVVNYISSFTTETTTSLTDQKITDFLDPIDYTKNVFKIVNPDGSSPAGDLGFFYCRLLYFETGSHRDSNGDTINQTYRQSILNDVSLYSSAVEANSCNCTIEGTLDFINSQINNLNLNNNCSNTDCRDTEGNRIPCASNNIDLTNQISVQNSIIAKTEVNNNTFNLLTESERNQFISTISVSLFVLLIVLHTLLTHYPRKYPVIIISFIILYFMIVVVTYLVYSNSFGFSNFTDIFSGLI